MKTVDENMYEEPAKIAIKHILAFLAYEGENPIYFKKAKAASVIVNAHGKIVQSATNRMRAEIDKERMKKQFNG